MKRSVLIKKRLAMLCACQLTAASIVAVVPMVATAAGQLSFSLDMQSHWMLETDESQSHDFEMDVTYEQPLMDGMLTLIGRGRIDLEETLNPPNRESFASDSTDTYSTHSRPWLSGPHGEVALREAWWQTSTDTTFWRIGKQQVVWGEADGLKVLDVVNPQSFREFILDD